MIHPLPLKASRHALLVSSALAGIIALNITAQIVFFRGSFHNEVLDRSTVDFFDAYGYVGKAQRFAAGESFRNVFFEGYHPPGYSLLLAGICHISPRPLFTARLLQAFLCSLIPFAAFLLFRQESFGPGCALAAAGAVAAWLPLYYFTRTLYPESAGIVCLAVLMVVLTKLRRRPLVRASCAGVCAAALVYLKANQLLVVVPVFSFFLIDTVRFKSALIQGIIMTATLALLVLPWSIWISHTNACFVPISTAQGLNLFIGAGARRLGGESERRPSIAARTMNALDLFEPQLLAEVEREAQEAPSLAMRSRIFQRAAVRVWIQRPVRTTLYGVSKVLHAFGFSFRNAFDAVVALQAIAAMFLSLWLWALKRFRHWCVFFWASGLAAILQAFLFLPAQRFKTTMFDLPAMVIIMMGACVLWTGITEQVHRTGRTFRRATA